MLRAPSGLLLLLMAGLAFAATPSPTLDDDTTAAAAYHSSWLSLTTSDQQWATCPPPPADFGPFCPPPCPANSTKNTQCLYYLKESHKEEVCGPDLGPERRRDVLHGLRMRQCCEHAVDQALSEDAFHGGSACRDQLDTLLKLDMVASCTVSGQAKLLTRYDCEQNYSIASHSDCTACQVAYWRWVCSSLVPHYARAGAGAAGERRRQLVRPCLNVCQDVEQKCPYLIPGDWTNITVPGESTAHPTPQYAGEPTFLCLDSNIPESSQQRVNSWRGDEDCCYTYCGAPGRGSRGGGGGGGFMELLDVCEHCPGRPRRKNGSEDAPAPVYRAGAPPNRTFNKVSLLWTAWIIYITLIEHTQTISDILLQCLLVLCATSVRTTLRLIIFIAWTKTKCGPCS